MNPRTNNNNLLNKGKSIYLKLGFYNFLIAIITLFLAHRYNYKISVATILFIILILLVILPFFISKDIFHPFNIFFMTSQFLFIYNMIDVHINKNNFRYGNLSDSFFENSFILAISIILLWYLFMYLGYFSGKKLKDSRVINKFNYTIVNPRKISFVLIGVSFLSFIYILAISGGISGMLEAMSNRVEAYAGLAYFTKLVSLGTIGSLILLINGDTKISFLIIILIFAMLALFGGRGAAIFTTILPYLIVYNYNNEKIKKITLASLGSLFGLLFIGIGNYRLYQETRLDFTGLLDVLSTMAGSSQGGEILPSLAGSLVLGHIEYGKGKTLKNIFLAPIPRSIWANKPMVDETGIIGRELINGPDKWGLPPGPYGISFYNFHYLGVIIIAFLTGLLIYKIYKQVVLDNENYEKKGLGLVIYSILISSLFNIVSTSAQINLIWYVLIFIILIKIDRTL